MGRRGSERGSDTEPCNDETVSGSRESAVSEGSEPPSNRLTQAPLLARVDKSLGIVETKRPRTQQSQILGADNCLLLGLS